MIGYPFDAAALLQNKRALRKELAAQGDLVEKRVAILSGTTVAMLKDMLELFLLDSGIRPVFHVGEYNRYYEDVVFGDQALQEFRPDVVFLNTGLHNIPQLPAAGTPAAQCDALLQSAREHFTAVWDAAERLGCPVIQNNFEYPRVRVMGSYEAVDPSGKVRFVNRLNEIMADYACAHRHLYVHDFNYLAAQHGIGRFCDPAAYNSYKLAEAPAFVPYLAHSVACMIRSLFGKNKKALMLDLDNTLWHGVIGDDGVEGIQIGVENPVGMAHAELQQYAKELAGIGVILGVCSKNEDAAARSGFTHPSSILKEEDFLTFKANWEPKSQNLAASARELNIGADSLVFADDNPAERELVRGSGLGCAVPELTVAERFAETIAGAGYFEVTSLSDDDRRRTEMYRQNAARAAQQSGFADYGAYLRSLEMRGYIGPFSEGALERITQLANKTNQFNLTTRRYTPEEMEARMRDPKVVALAGRLEDKFGDNGIVTELIANEADGALDIELWIMSCRVFKRELEYAMFDALVAEAKRRGCTRITGSYYKTAKNGIVADFYGSLGFAKTGQNGEDSRWQYDLPEEYQPKNHAIEVHPL